MEEEFRLLLTEAPGVAALAPAERICWRRLPQGCALPAVVLNVVSNLEGLTQQGPDGLWQGRVQVDCYGRTYAETLALSRAITTLLRGYRGGGFRLVVLDRRQDYDEPDAADRPRRISLDFLTNWRDPHG